MNAISGAVCNGYDEGVNQNQSPQTGRRHDVWLLSAVLVLLTCTLVYRIRRAGEFSYTEDEAHHAVTGLYFADLLRDLPLAHPVQYTYEYYARYPALGLIHWPPFFHLCEGILFDVVGPSTRTARVTVLLFALVGVSFWFLLVREMLNSAGATFSALALAFAPALLVYEQSVMLEAPSVALCIVASYFWMRVLRDGTRRIYITFAIFFFLALFTKQQSAYLMVFCLLTIWTARKWKVVFNRYNLLAAAIVLLILGGFALLTINMHRPSVVDHLLIRDYRLLKPMFYLRHLPEQLGWPMLLLSIAGIATSPWWSSRKNTTFMLLWILSAFLSVAFLPARSERYLIYWVPAFLYFACWPFVIPLRQRWVRAVVCSVACFVVAASAWQAWRVPYHHIDGFSDAAASLAQADTRGGIILYDGFWDGNFIFQMRVHDPQRRFVVFTKGLHATRITSTFASEELAHDDADILRVLDTYGIRYLAVTDQSEYGFPVQQTLRELVRTPQFRLVQTIPIECDAYPRVSNVRIYENLQAGKPTASTLRLRMMTLTHDIEIPLAKLGIE